MNQPCCDKTWKLLLCFPINVDCNTQDRNKLNCAAGLHFWKLSTSEMTEIPATCTSAKPPHFSFHITRLQGFWSFDICQWGSPMSLDHFQGKKSCFEWVQEVSNLLEWYCNQRTWGPSLKAAQGILSKKHNKYKEWAVWAFQEASPLQIWTELHGREDLVATFQVAQDYCCWKPFLPIWHTIKTASV